MSHDPAMKHCPDCHAPNPASRTTCYACGQSLNAAPPAPVGTAGERSYPCLTCRADVPYSAAVCPGCGRVVRPSHDPDAPLILNGPEAAARALSAVELQMAAAPPPGWNVELLPDGTARLTRSGWLRLRHDAAPAGAVALLLAIVAGPAALRRMGLDGGGPYVLHAAHHPADWLLIVFGGVFAVVSLLWFVWAVFGREELRAGSDFLKVRREFGPYRSVRRLGAGSLRLDVYHRHTGRGGHVLERRLTAYGETGGRTVLEHRSYSELWDGMMPDEGPAALGRYLAAITGWPFLEPQPGRWS